MNRLNEASRHAMEDRVRDAFGAAAETVTTQDLPGPPTPRGRARAVRGLAAWGARVRVPALVPATAAAAVAVVIAAGTVVVPKLAAGPQADVAAGGLAGAPAFFAGVAAAPNVTVSPSTVVNIYRSATGRVVGTVRAPGALGTIAAVSRLGGDDDYVAAVVSRSACATKFFRFTIDSHGRPGQLSPLSWPGQQKTEVPGEAGDLTTSTVGGVLAYTASGPCVPPGQEWVGVIHLATGKTTTWSYPTKAAGVRQGLRSLSLTEGGAVLGFAAGPLAPAGWLGSHIWLLPTNSPPGPITRQARQVPGLIAYTREVLNRWGTQVYAETPVSSRGSSVELGLYSTRTGKRIKLLGSLGQGLGTRGFSGLAITVDVSRQHLIAYGHPGPERVTMVNLTTGHKVSVPAGRLIVNGELATVAW